MENGNLIYIIIPSMIIFMIGFWIVFAIVLKYLFSTFKLLSHIKTNEDEIWISLGKPTLLPKFEFSGNPFKNFLSQLKFLSWFRKGGAGSTSSETMELVKKTNRMFKIAMVSFIVLFVSFFIIFCSLVFLLSKTGNATGAGV